MRTFILISVFSSLFACKGDRPESSPAPGRWEAIPPDFKTAQLVPAADDRKYPIAIQADLPVINGLFYVQSAGELLLRYQSSPQFNTADDRLIFDQLKGYADRRRPFRLSMTATPIDPDGNVFAMAYSCTEDRYYMPGGLRMSPTIFAAMLYHEVSHAAFCAAELERRGLTRGVDDVEIAKIDADVTPCLREYRSYAAGIRAFLAFHADRRTPVVLTDLKDVNAASVDTMLRSWHALSEDRFCSWFAQTFTVRP